MADSDGALKSFFLFLVTAGALGSVNYYAMLAHWEVSFISHVIDGACDNITYDFAMVPEKGYVIST